MAETTDGDRELLITDVPEDDPNRVLAEMGEKDPESARLLYSICDLHDKHGQGAVDLLLDSTDRKREQLIDERRAAFRVIEGRA